MRESTNVEAWLSGPVKRAICLLFGSLSCALVALTLFPTGTRDRNVTSPTTVRTEPYRQVAGAPERLHPMKNHLGSLARSASFQRLRWNRPAGRD